MPVTGVASPKFGGRRSVDRRAFRGWASGGRPGVSARAGGTASQPSAWAGGDLLPLAGCRWQPAGRGTPLPALGPTSATLPLQISGSHNLNPKPPKPKPHKTWRGPVVRAGGRQALGGKGPEARGVLSRTAAVLPRRDSDERCVTSILWSCIEMRETADPNPLLLFFSFFFSQGNALFRVFLG